MSTGFVAFYTSLLIVLLVLVFALRQKEED